MRLDKSRTLTSAWIETFFGCTTTHLQEGRTLTSAWIETMTNFVFDPPNFVALSRVRGLKPQGMNKMYGAGNVALSRVRGLKQGLPVRRIRNALSHSHECVD